MKLSFVIPTINQFDMLFKDCLDSFDKFHEKGKHEIIVVEDGSPPSLQAEIEKECQKRGIIFIKSDKNCGFPITCNKGIRAATGDAIVLVNNDIIFTQAVDKPIIESFHKDKHIGIVGSLLFYPNKTIQHGGIIMTGMGGFTHRGWHKTTAQAPEVLRQGYLIGVTGALFAVKRECFNDIGLFNENYFLSCDDTELCVRSWSKNWRVFYNPDIRAIHAEGATRGRTDTQKQRDHRIWYMKELETWNKFQNDLKTYDLSKCQMQVNECNAEVWGARKTKAESESITFQGNVKEREEDAKKIKMLPGKKVFIRRTGALGDVILATGVVKKIKQLFPETSIVVSTLHPEVFRDSPHVSHVVKGHSGFEGVDRVIDLDMVYEMNPKIPIWEAYSNAALGISDFDLRPEMFSTEHDLASLKKKMDLSGRIAVLHMGVSWTNRTWPRHRWLEVAKKLSSIGYKVVTVGRGGDYRSDLFQGVLNMVDNLSVHEIRELCKKASVFVGVDSGILHIAQTTDVPIVGIFTIANPDYRIIPRASRTIALVPKTECRFCLHEQEPPVTFVECRYGTNHCLNDISSEDVVKATSEIKRDSC